MTAIQLSPETRRILLIEDEEAHALIIGRSFERQGAYRLTLAANMAEAIEAIERDTFDLVIADWRLPDGEAFDLLRGRRRFPLLIMTGHGDETVAVRAMRAGALDYVVKSEHSLRDLPHLAESAIRQWADLIAREQAQEQLYRALEERTVLLKEVHHRVKNNLQIVCTLLSMQIDRSPASLSAIGPLREAYSRIIAMALVHEQVYQSETLAGLDFSAYIGDFSARLFDAYCVEPSRVKLELDVTEINLTVDAAVPFGLILNELLSNTLKHAFPGQRAGVIRVSLRQTDSENAELVVSDNGVGLPAGFSIEQSKSLGLQVVQTLTRQLRASLSIVSDGGTTFRLTWKPEAK